MTEITKEQIVEAMRILADDHDFANSNHLVQCYVKTIDEIRDLAIRGLETQRKPIEQAPKDGDVLLVFGGQWKDIENAGGQGNNTNKATLVYFDDKCDDQDGFVWRGCFDENGLECRLHYKPTHFISRSAFGEPK